MKTISRTFFATAALALGSSAYMGCVADRPSRNGVFNENQYVRKEFLTQKPDAQGDQKDNGWLLKATVTDVTTPNVLGGDMFGIWPGAHSGGVIVKFRVTQDKLEMINTRELSSTDSVGRIPEVLNAWPIANVDLKYRVNLDGEKTNFYEENQELDWNIRQWVKINFAKNDMSDIAPLGTFANANLAKCTDLANATASLVPDSFLVDEKTGYFQWKVQVSTPLKFSDADCYAAYGPMGAEALRLGRENATFNLLYSMTRAKAATAVTYQPLEIDEHDPILHKYGPIRQINTGRDPATGQKTARILVNRFDPATPSDKPVVWYFDQGFPAEYKTFYADIKKQTNQLLQDSGATLRFDFKEANDGMPEGQTRQFGDVRYNWLRWLSDRDVQPSFAGATQFFTDPRTGETLTSDIVYNDFEFQEIYPLRIAAYLKSVGAGDDFLTTTWPVGAACKEGDTMPIVPEVEKSVKNVASPLFAKMQQYLQKPVSEFGNLGPKDFIAAQDADFFRAYYPLVAYSMFADPDTNSFVDREGGQGVYGPGAGLWKLVAQNREFHEMANQIDRGLSPYQDVDGSEGVKNANAFSNSWRDLTIAHKNHELAMQALPSSRTHDDSSAFSFEAVIARDARHCITVNGHTHFETREEWLTSMTRTYWQQVMWHEFGHAVGLEHNFMGSVDQPNFLTYKGTDNKDHYGLFSSSVMEYNSAPDRVFSTPGWGPYDQGAISWIYGNTKRDGAVGTSISGQASATTPWKDPHGFVNGKERSFLFCDESHLKYTPFCRQGDLGTTPSEIVANAIEMYEWGYKFRNYRSYRKYWDNRSYVDAPTNLIVDMRRWMSLWNFDWSQAEIADTLRRIGVTDPGTNPDNQDYYGQLTGKFRHEISSAAQMIAAFHKATIQQSAGERPYASVYDKQYGDQQQQGIILDKLTAMQSFAGLWPTDNYDVNQAGQYLSYYRGFGEPTYDALAQDVVSTMVGTSYDAYRYFIPTAVALFAQDTHRQEFSGNVQTRDWLGGVTFTRQEDFLNYFKEIAVAAGYTDGTVDCSKITRAADCGYDVTKNSDAVHQVIAPDDIQYVWSYVSDRHTWAVARKDRNIASYKILFQYNDDLLRQLDDGTYGAYELQRPVKYMLDSFLQYN